VTVGYGQNLDDGFFFPIHNGERKTVEDEFAGSVFATGPAFRRSDYSIRCLIYLRHKIESRGFVSFQIPSYGRFQLRESCEVKVERLNGH
jgi:hypothetical protein